MKKFFVSTVVFSFLFALGCQEHSITDPVSSETAGSLNREFSYKHNMIKFERLLVDPSASFRNYLTIWGTVEYEHRIVYLDPIPPAPQKYISVKLSMNAEIKDPDSPLDVVWNVSGESEDIIYIKGDGLTVLTKYYNVEGRDDGMGLLTKFIVTNEGVSLSSMWLEMNADNKFNKAMPRDTVTYPPVQITVFD